MGDNVGGEIHRKEKLLEVGVVGVCGTMGKVLAKVIKETQHVNLTCGIERKGHPWIGNSLPKMFSTMGGGDIIPFEGCKNVSSKPQVLICFASAPGVVFDILEVVEDLDNPRIVMATTALENAHLDALSDYSRERAVVQDYNFSLGVAVAVELCKKAAQMLGDDFAVEIVELHHDQKKDAPSGTAVKLGKAIAAVLERDPDEVFVNGRKGMVGKRTKEEIGIQAVRGGDVVGEHMVYFLGQGERIMVAHIAHSKETFARGAVRLAKWVMQQPPGMYNMGDYLGLNKK